MSAWDCDGAHNRLHPGMRARSLAPVLIFGGLLFAIALLAIFAQRKMREHETGASAAANVESNGTTERANQPPPDPNSMLDEHVERQRLADLFPDTLVNVWGIRYKILEPGEGPKPVAGNKITAHYVGRLLDGTAIDSSYERGKPITFQLMSNAVIRGWNESFIDMRKGEKRLIVIPYKYGYGSSGRGPVPPRAPLVFEVELVDFE